MSEPTHVIVLEPVTALGSAAPSTAHAYWQGPANHNAIALDTGAAVSNEDDDATRCFDALARELARLRSRKQAQRAQASGYHTSPVLAVAAGQLRFDDELAAGLRAGSAQPGATYDATVYFLNASGLPQPDYEPDLRMLRLRLHAGDTDHDLTLVNAPTFHVRDAAQLLAFARATADGPLDRARGLWELTRHAGAAETARIFQRFEAARSRPVRSLALETYFSRGALDWGPATVRCSLRPAGGSPYAPSACVNDPHYLRREFARRLAAGDVAFELCAQTYRDPFTTPIDDASRRWSNADAPSIRVARLHLRKQRVVTAISSQASRRRQPSRCSTPAEHLFEPQGSLARACHALEDVLVRGTATAAPSSRRRAALEAASALLARAQGALAARRPRSAEPPQPTPAPVRGTGPAARTRDQAAGSVRERGAQALP